MPELKNEERPKFGELVNKLKTKISEDINKKISGNKKQRIRRKTLKRKN